MKITVVVDNSVPISSPSPFVGEHGYSLLVEVNSKKILLDAGQSDAVVRNLSLLGIHPDQLDAIVFSHGHYDHTGGLYHLLNSRSKSIPVYAHESIFQSRYSTRGGRMHFIGIPYVKDELTTMGADWHLTSEPMELVPNLLFSGQIPRLTDYETGDAKLVVCSEQGCDCQDEIIDDSSLYYSSSKGLVVIAGCSHSGLVNTVEYGLKLTGHKQLAGWIGGTHLGPASTGQQERTLDKIEQYDPSFIAASHCTGFVMMAELYKRFGDRFITGFVGQTIQVG